MGLKIILLVIKIISRNYLEKILKCLNRNLWSQIDFLSLWKQKISRLFDEMRSIEKKMLSAWDKTTTIATEDFPFLLHGEYSIATQNFT